MIPPSFTEETAQEEFLELEEALKTTDLPKTIPEEPFNDYLFNLREKIARLGDYHLAIQQQQQQNTPPRSTSRSRHDTNIHR